jgi:N-carbamoylputrescine amidase
MAEYSYGPEQVVANYVKLKNDKVLLDADAFEGAAATPKAPRNDGKIVVAATQFTACGLNPSDIAGFLDRATSCVEQAVAAGANLVLLQELFLGPYFCQSIDAVLLKLADPVEGNLLIAYMQKLAKKHSVVLPISFYERHNNAYYNSVVMIDSDGSVSDVYRKSHIPDGTGYLEKYYFTPGDTGFRVFDTQVGKVGIAICWDQWFPEAARAMSLQGADVLLYPTAIGSEPQDPAINSADHWQRAMQGHAASNMVPVVASNRFGPEVLLNDDGTEKQRITFYGRSFITDNTGAKIAECEPNSADKPTSFVISEIDPEKNRHVRAAWGLFRDRRPELYGLLLTKDGKNTSGK